MGLPPGGGGGGAGAPNVPTDLRFELFGTVGGAWVQRQLPPIHSCSFGLQERGGMDSGNVEILVPWEDLDLTGNEFLDVILFGERIYRGWVRVPARNVESPETASIALQSAVEILNHIQVRWKLAYGGAGADLATIAGDILTAFVADVGRFGSFVAQDLDATGILLTEFDARGMSVSAAFNKLCDHAAGAAIWGIEASFDTAAPPLPIHRIYFRPKPTATSKYYSIGSDVAAFVYPPDTGSVINVVNLTGGPVTQPNLIYNPSFEEIAPASETVANLLLDYSFEEGSAAWTLTGDRKFTGQDGTAMGSPRDGKYWCELDQNTEKAEQTVRASYTNVYTGIMWTRQEAQGGARQVKLTLEGLNSGGSVVVSADTGFVTPGNDWEKRTVDLDPTASSTVVQIRWRAETNGGSAANDGVLIDFVALIEKNGEGAVGWRRIVAGVADPTTFQWNFNPSTEAKHGGYAVRSDPASIAGASDYVEIRTTADKRIEVFPNEKYSLICYVDPGASAVDFSIGIIEYNEAGTVLVTNETATKTTTGGGSPWEDSGFFILSAGTDGDGITTNVNTRSVEIFFRHRDNDEVYIDSFFFCKGSIPDDVRTNLDYWTSENYERRFRTDDALFTGGLALGTDADASITTYGERETDESHDLVTDYDTATIWAQDYFNAYAVPSVMASLSVECLEAAADLLYTTDDKMQILGLNDAPDALNPVRVGYTIQGDKISFRADLGSELPSFEQLFRTVQAKEKSRTF